MRRTDHRTSWHASLRSLLLALLALAGGPAQAETTRCVDTVQELVAALEEADTDQMRINVVRGTYALGGTYFISATHGFSLVGGWDAGCGERLPDPRLTVLTGIGDLELSSRDFIRVESLAFIDSGYLDLASIQGRRRVDLVRVWLEGMCAGARCDSEHAVHPVRLQGHVLQLNHVVATGHGPVGCAVTMDAAELQTAGVAHSLFTDNDARGLCVQKLDDGPFFSDDYELVVSNSLFWSNGGDDILTRYSPRISLRYNIYQSLDLTPDSSIAPVGTLNASPQFQDQAGGDFRLRAPRRPSTVAATHSSSPRSTTSWAPCVCSARGRTAARSSSTRPPHRCWSTP
jgi:hypothetical protein